MRARIRKNVTAESIRVIDPSKAIRVQLDPRTIVTVKDMSAVELWMSKYPTARIIN